MRPVVAVPVLAATAAALRPPYVVLRVARQAVAGQHEHEWHRRVGGGAGGRVRREACHAVPRLVQLQGLLSRVAGARGSEAAGQRKQEQRT